MLAQTSLVSKLSLVENGEVLEQYPGKIELVNPADAAAANQKVPGSLRHALFGNPNAPANSPDATGVLAANFNTNVQDQTFKKDGQAGNDGSLHTALGQGIEPTQMLNIQFAASQYGSSNFSVSQAPTNDGMLQG